MYKTFTMELAGRTLRVDIGRVGKYMALHLKIVPTFFFPVGVV